jgi:hypothetical protein
MNRTEAGAAVSNHERGDCFVIAPIGDANSQTRHRSDLVLQHIIVPAALSAGFKSERVKRADQIPKPGIITSQVVQFLTDAELIIADLSEHNANVFYELAVRHAVRKPVILLIQKGTPIPFDVAPNRVIHYDLSDWDSPKSCADELLKQIQSGDANTYNPISAAIDLQSLMKSPDPMAQGVADLAARIESLSSDVKLLAGQVGWLSTQGSNAQGLYGFGSPPASYAFNPAANAAGLYFDPSPKTAGSNSEGVPSDLRPLSRYRRGLRPDGSSSEGSNVG